MFDLNNEVRKWCLAALPEGCDSDQVDELQDHLLCEIERLEGEGLSSQEAFEQATRRLGEAKMLMNEYSKNQSFAARLCALDRKMSTAETIVDPNLRKKANKLITGHSILWAAAMLATALLTRDSENAGQLVLLVFIPLWFASFLMINRTMKSMESPA